MRFIKEKMFDESAIGTWDEVWDIVSKRLISTPEYAIRETKQNMIENTKNRLERSKREEKERIMRVQLQYRFRMRNLALIGLACVFAGSVCQIVSAF